MSLYILRRIGTGLVMLVAALVWFAGRRLRNGEPSPPAPLPAAPPDPRERGV